MNSQPNPYTILHRPSRRINRVAIAAASNRADMRNATVGPPPFDSPRFRTGYSERSLPVSQSDTPTYSAGQAPSQLYSITVPKLPASSQLHDDSNHPTTHWSPRPTSQITSALPRVEKPRRSGKQLILGSWNVRTMLDRTGSARPERRTALIAMELRRYNIDIAALSETRLADLGKLREVDAGYTFYWVGHPADSRREHGVCFAMSDRVSSLLIGEPVGLSPRIMSVRMRLGRGKFASLISVYSPTLNHPEEEKNQFYPQLSLLIEATPASDRLFLMGDFDAPFSLLAFYSESFRPSGK